METIYVTNRLVIEVNIIKYILLYIFFSKSTNDRPLRSHFIIYHQKVETTFIYKDQSVIKKLCVFCESSHI